MRQTQIIWMSLYMNCVASSFNGTLPCLILQNSFMIGPSEQSYKCPCSRKLQVKNHTNYEIAYFTTQEL